MSRRDTQASQLSNQDLAALGDEVERVPERGFRGLTFPPRLEEAFERETGTARTRYLVATGVVALLIYDLFLITDRMMIADVFGTALVVRLGIVTPIALLIFLAVWRRPSPFLRETLETAVTVLASLSVTYLFVISNSANATYYHPGLALVLMYGNVVVRLRFRFALVASVVTIAAYIVTQAVHGTLALDVGVLYVTYLAATAIFTLIANYTIERDQRFEYLVSLRERCRRVALTAVNTKLSELSRRDPLTGIANRRFFEETLAREIKRAQRYGRQLTLLMIDIEKFRNYNDRHGRPMGDQLLRDCAHLMRALLRASDLVARYGGDEFVVLLPEITAKQGKSVADKLRRIKIGSLASKEEIAMTIGCAAYKKDMTAETLIELADRDMNKQKVASARM
jgi:diguanylate cyclase (GGDEF)-like protein